MNKRIKLKKGILKKKCDKNCINHRIIVMKELVTSNICIGCKHKAIIEKNVKKITVSKINILDLMIQETKL